MKPNHGLDFSTTRGPCIVHGPVAYLDRRGRCTACLTLARRNCGTCGQVVVGESCRHCHGCLVPWHPRHTGGECQICAKNADARGKVLGYVLGYPLAAIILIATFFPFVVGSLYLYGVFKTADALVTLRLIEGGAFMEAMVFFWLIPGLLLFGAVLYGTVVNTASLVSKTR